MVLLETVVPAVVADSDAVICRYLPLQLEIVMPEETPLRESHDIGIMLQHKIERLEEVRGTHLFR